MNNKLSISIFLVIICTLLTSFGQYFIKQGADQITTLLSAISWPIIVGLGLYALGSVILIISLKDGELSMIYPFISLSFIWVSLIGIFLLGEILSLVNWIGIVSIVGGVTLIGLGGKSG